MIVNPEMLFLSDEVQAELVELMEALIIDGIEGFFITGGENHIGSTDYSAGQNLAQN